MTESRKSAEMRQKIEKLNELKFFFQELIKERVDQIILLEKELVDLGMVSGRAIEDRKKSIDGFSFLLEAALNKYVFDSGKALKDLFLKAQEVRRLDLIRDSAIDKVFDGDENPSDEVVKKAVEIGMEATDVFTDSEFTLKPVFDWLTDQHMERWRQALEQAGVLPVSLKN